MREVGKGMNQVLHFRYIKVPPFDLASIMNNSPQSELVLLHVGEFGAKK